MEPYRTRITELFGIDVPVVQAGMVWVSGWKLATAVSEAGGLGLIGAGSMKPEVLREHIRAAFAATRRPFGVNLPLIRGDVAELAKAAVEEGVKILFTSAGHPAKFASFFKERNCTLVHVVSNVKQARKAEESGCDAVVTEGFEAGGHNGSDEITTMCLVPQVADGVAIPVIAAGGIADGRGMLAALSLGAEGVQVGTRFAATVESSAHETYKRKVIEAQDTSTILTLKKLTPVRLIKNGFALEAQKAEASGAGKEELAALLGEKRERAGIFDGDETGGEIEAGQIAGLIREILPAAEVLRRMMDEVHRARHRLIPNSYFLIPNSPPSPLPAARVKKNSRTAPAVHIF